MAQIRGKTGGGGETDAHGGGREVVDHGEDAGVGEEVGWKMTAAARGRGSRAWARVLGGADGVGDEFCVHGDGDRAAREEELELELLSSMARFRGANLGEEERVAAAMRENGEGG